jgi:hypothetical protein
LVLGEKLWEEKGKAIGMAIKSIGPEGVHMEETFTSTVKGFGRSPNGTNMGTLNIVTRPDGFFSGTGQGIFTTQDGDSVVWKLHGIGKPEAGKHKGVYTLEFMTTSQKLSWMNSLIAITEGVLDPKTMELSGTGYEWK